MAIGRTNACGGGGTVVNIDIPRLELQRRDATPLSLGRAEGAAATSTMGNVALFAGGNYARDNYGYVSNIVDAYTPTLERKTAPPLTMSKTGPSGIAVGDYILFGGGRTYDGQGTRRDVDTYTSSLIKNTAPNLSVAIEKPITVANSDYALFFSSFVDTYTSQLVKNIATAPSVPSETAAAGTIGENILFGGGYNYQEISRVTAIVDSYSSTLIKKSAAPLSQAREKLKTARAGDYLLFGGGVCLKNGKYEYFDTVDAYSLTLMRKTATPLSSARAPVVGISVDNNGIFIGSASGYDSTVEVYSPTLTRKIASPMKFPRYDSFNTMINNTALIAGGAAIVVSGQGAIQTDSIESYSIKATINISAVYGAETKYKLNGITNTTTKDLELLVDTPVSGNVKYISKINYQ